MTIILYVVIYTCAVVFLAASIVKVVQYAGAPLHLRWELYPVPHEEPRRVEHGGSYFEETDWWSKPSRFHLAGEVKAMASEILFLKGLWEFNRGMWLCSFPFHFGLYLLITTIKLLGLTALLVIFLPGAAGTPLLSVLHLAYATTGVSGSVLAFLGALFLLARRLADKTLKAYTTPGDVLNLMFFLAAIGVLGAGRLFQSPGSPGMLTLTRGILTFDTSLEVPGLLFTGLALGALLVAYIPLTHMSHFIAKYFTYHSVRWDDQPEVRNANVAKAVAEYLTYRPTWRARHVGADGTKTWADIVTANPAPEVKK